MKKPVWQLTGDAVREGIDPYDGTLYFEDIATNRDVSVIAETAKKIKADGYRGIKIKLGRADKWLPGEAGVQRDIDAFIALREAVGSNFNLMADPNNGYAKNFDWAVRLLKACAPYNMYFIEEIFPDNASMYRKLQNALLEDNFFIPIADGENINDLSLFDQYMKDGIYNYLQPDMHTCGYSNLLALARKAQAFPHIKVIPHVWQSQLGLIMSLHVSRIQGNIVYVEDSRYFEHVVMQDGYLFQEGQWFIPDKPGWGVSLSPDYQQFIVDKEIVVK
jgi:L-alanine-DL-glutamate epimerase-like enolase superfamily enzyme